MSTAYVVTVIVLEARHAAELDRAILPQVARAMTDSVAAAISGRIRQAAEGAASAGPAFRLGGAATLREAVTAHAPTLESGALDWDGGLASASIGLDGRPRPDVLLGVALSYSDGAFDSDIPGFEGDYDITMTSVHPYLGWTAPSGRLSLWAAVGYGEGEIESVEGEDDVSRRDVELRSVALGASGQLLKAGATTLRLKGEATHTTLETDGFAGTLSLAPIEERKVEASRVRVGVEATRTRTLANGAQLLPSLEAGMRYDGGGEGDSGAALELGGGVPAIGAQDLRHDAGTQAPAYGARLAMRLGYGFPLALNGRDGMLTPYSELTLGATNRYRAGMNWKAGTRFDLTLLGECLESNSAPAEHAILLKGEVRF